MSLVPIIHQCNPSGSPKGHLSQRNYSDSVWIAEKSSFIRGTTSGSWHTRLASRQFVRTTCMGLIERLSWALFRSEQVFVASSWPPIISHIRLAKSLNVMACKVASAEARSVSRAVGFCFTPSPASRNGCILDSTWDFENSRGWRSESYQGSLR